MSILNKQLKQLEYLSETIDSKTLHPIITIANRTFIVKPIQGGNFRVFEEVSSDVETTQKLVHINDYEIDKEGFWLLNLMKDTGIKYEVIISHFVAKRLKGVL